MFFMFLQVFKNRSRMLKSQSILEKIYPEDTKVFSINQLNIYFPDQFLIKNYKLQYNFIYNSIMHYIIKHIIKM